MQILLVLLILSLFNSVLCWDNKIKFRTRWHRYRPAKVYGPPKKPLNFCLASLCPRGEEHISCLTQFWGANCGRPRIGVDMLKFRQPILDLHNHYRNEFEDNVGKSWPGHRTIPPVTWDDNLSLLAMRISNLCIKDISPYCVNLPEYRNVAESSDYLLHHGIPHTRNHFNLFLKRWFKYQDDKDHFDFHEIG
ncbi:uncharacterized protein Dwil_GK19202 [Drosophila willistoni]|uniref:SCP domain-containing protein n=1 Tax=Drosophila willistoni TaxID=7260 RepID=B4NA63_DROWI|nr:uncharacterized protein Dwil_GK19202 [Drosophila willistoni]